MKPKDRPTCHACGNDPRGCAICRRYIDKGERFQHVFRDGRNAHDNVRCTRDRERGDFGTVHIDPAGPWFGAPSIGRVSRLPSGAEATGRPDSSARARVDLPPEPRAHGEPGGLFQPAVEEDFL